MYKCDNLSVKECDTSILINLVKIYYRGTGHGEIYKRFQKSTDPTSTAYSCAGAGNFAHRPRCKKLYPAGPEPTPRVVISQEVVQRYIQANDPASIGFVDGLRSYEFTVLDTRVVAACDKDGALLTYTYGTADGYFESTFTDGGLSEISHTVMYEDADGTLRQKTVRSEPEDMPEIRRYLEHLCPARYRLTSRTARSICSFRSTAVTMISPELAAYGVRRRTFETHVFRIAKMAQRR